MSYEHQQTDRLGCDALNRCTYKLHWPLTGWLILLSHHFLCFMCLLTQWSWSWTRWVLSARAAERGAAGLSQRAQAHPPLPHYPSCKSCCEELEEMHFVESKEWEVSRARNASQTARWLSQQQCYRKHKVISGKESETNILETLLRHSKTEWLLAVTASVRKRYTDWFVGLFFFFCLNNLPFS